MRVLPLNAHARASEGGEVESEHRYRALLLAQPAHADTLIRLGELLLAQHRYPELIVHCQRGLEQNPSLVALYQLLGSAFFANGEAGAAAEVYSMALPMQSGNAELHNNYAVALRALGHLEDAESHLLRAISLRPRYFDALVNLGNVVKQRGEPGRAIDCYRQALEIRPGHAATYSNVGNALQALGQFDGALEFYERALGLSPQLPQAHWNRSLLWLQLGDFARGWPEYEWGFACGERVQRSFSVPRWDGAALNGRRILVWSEQGFGDTLQFARYLPRVLQAGGRVLFECPAALSRLYQRSGFADEIVAREDVDDGKIEFDVHIPLLSLPALYSRAIEQIPAPQAPVIAAELVQQWRDRIGNQERLRIGIVWSGNTEQPNNRRRACPLHLLLRLAEIPGTAFYSLQKGPPARELAHAAGAGRVTALDAQLYDFADTAAAMLNLDLIVTVDTAVAHLAGTLGREVWLLLDAAADWRWLAGRDDSPWYASARLFRQISSGDWDGTLAQVDAALRQRAAQPLHRKTMTITSETIASPDRIPQLLQKAVAAHSSGELDLAKKVYTDVLDLTPDNVDALHLLGVIEHSGGRLARAAELIERAIELKPNVALLHSSLGSVYQQRGDVQAAAVCFKQAIDCDPCFADAHVLLAANLHARGELDAAASYYESHQKLCQDHADSFYNLGLIYEQQGKIEAAARCLERAVQLEPQQSRMHCRLSHLLQISGDLERALEHYQISSGYDPNNVEADLKQGDIHLTRHRLDAAAECYNRVLSKRPELAEAWNNLGNVRKAQARPREAAECYFKAIELQPERAEVYSNLGALCRDFGSYGEAVNWYRKALNVKPDFVQALANLIQVYQDICFWDGHEQLLDKLAQWTARFIEQKQRSPITPFYAVTLSISPSLQRDIAANYVQTVIRPTITEPAIKITAGARRSGRLRIGYVSSDFYTHATAQLMLSLFGLHDRDEFEIFAYSFGSDDGSEYRTRIERDTEHFIDISDEHYARTAQRVADDGINILVDLKGYTRDIRPEIFALRPAPIQVNYLGYPGSLGAEYMDYMISDANVTPPESRQFFREQLVYMPHSYQVNDHRQAIAQTVPSRQACGLPETGFVFCCFNNNYKIEPTIFDAWMRILARVPGSVLWLLKASEEAQFNLSREAERRGIDPQRLVFAPRLPKPEHLARHAHADLLLDTLYCNAHTTASDALWAGLPLITCPGQTFAARVAASLLHAVGLPELVTASLQQYEDLAVTLASDKARLLQLSQRLQQNRMTQPLFDTPRYVGYLESAYRRMWALWEAGKPASHIVIPE